MGRPLAERMAERNRVEVPEPYPSVTVSKPPLRESVKEGQQIWVTIVKGEAIRRMDDDWNTYHLATLTTEARPAQGGVAIVGATLSPAMDRLEVEQEFQKYAGMEIFPPEDEW
jgi:hypothetical protein